jgi:uncharacterized integral membrane protein
MKDLVFKILVWVLTLPLLLAVVAFALFHYQTVSITLNPFGGTITVPLYLPVLIAMAFGFVIGTVLTWAAGLRVRAEKRALQKKISALEKELALKKAPTPIQQRHDYARTPLPLLQRHIP